MTTVRSSIIVRPFGAKQQAIISLEDTHFVIGSPAIRDTRTLPSRPVDLLLATLATDCTFTCQEGAAALGLPLQYVAATAYWTASNAAEIRFTTSGIIGESTGELRRYIENNSQVYELLSPTVSIALHFIV